MGTRMIPVGVCLVLALGLGALIGYGTELMVGGSAAPASSRLTPPLTADPSRTRTPTPTPWPTRRRTPTATPLSDAPTAAPPGDTPEPTRCPAFDIEVLQTPDIHGASSSDAPPLVWRVRDRARSVACRWGGPGAEPSSFVARETTGVVTDTLPVFVSRVADGEYALSLRPPLPPGQYRLLWRLLDSQTGQEYPAMLEAQVDIASPSATPTATPPATLTPTRRGVATPRRVTPLPSATPQMPTLAPTATLLPTACPTEMYDCHCKTDCHTDAASGRTVCRKVCERCSRVVCP